MSDTLILIVVIFIAYCFNETGKQLGKIIRLMEKSQSSDETEVKI